MKNMQIAVTMGAEEFLAFMNFRKEQPRLLTEVNRLDHALRELATAVDAALLESGGQVTVDAAAAREALRLAGKYL